MAQTADRLADKKRGSFVEVNLDKEISSTINIKVENISDAKIISEKLLNELFAKLNLFEENEEKIDYIDTFKTPYLFPSTGLAKILDTTPSIKTKLAIIIMIGPRLTDPRSKTDEFIQIFRYAEDKTKVEEILKARQQTLASSMFKVSSGGGGGRGEAVSGRGGRGSGLSVVRPGRGSPAGGRGITASPKPDMITTNKLISREEINISNDSSINSVIDFIQPTSEVINDTVVEVWEELVQSENARSSVTMRPFSTRISIDDIKSIRNSVNNISISNNIDNVRNNNMESIDTKDLVSIVASANDIIETDPMNVVDAIQSGRKSRRFSKFLPQNNNIQVDTEPTNTSDMVEPEISTIKAEIKNENIIENQTAEISVSFNSKRESVRASPVGIKLLKEKYLATGTDGSVILVSNTATTRPFVTAPKRRSTYLLSNESNTGSSNNTSSEEQKCDKAAVVHNVQMKNSDYVDSSGNYNIYSYDILVERNKLKMYNGLCQSDLEFHLDDSEFLNKFGLTKKEYNKLPKWRKIAQKKALLLF